ncbi:MAG: carbohydrate binding domain-containing protein [Dysgonamonadaceae bacterium]|jgi:hypothetical protein|nr:carbohydrate binding domain-containing protein [Dysgonamonadaceae bacterium]
MKKIFYTILLCLFTGIYATAQTNQVVNGSFEEVGEDGKPVGWEDRTPNSSPIEAATDIVRTGSYSLKVNSDWKDFILYYVPVIPTTGKTYNLSVWYNVQSFTNATPDRNFIGLAYIYLDENGNNLDAAGTISGQIRVSFNIGTVTHAVANVTLQTWQQIKLTTEGDVPANVAYIGFMLKPSSARVYFDDASFTEVDPEVPVKQDQSITGLSYITKTAGDADFDLSAVASSGLPVSYTSSNAAVATISGNTVTIVGEGTTVITASQAGNDDYNAAPDVTATLTVNSANAHFVSNPGFETVEDGVPTDWVYLENSSYPGDPLLEVVTDVKYEGNSSLKLTNTSNTKTANVIQYVPVTPGKEYVLSVWCNVLSYGGSSSGAALRYVYADAEGNSRLSISGSVDGSLEYEYTDEQLNTWGQLTISIGVVPESTPYIANIAYIGIILNTRRDITACFDNVSFTEPDPALKQDQTISGLTDITKTLDDDDFELSATASSGLPVTYSIPSGNGVAILRGENTVHIIEGAPVGSSTTITASQAGNHLWNPVELTVTLTLSNTTVVKQDQTITGFPALINKTTTDNDFELTATATSGLPVTYTSSNTKVAIIYGGDMVSIIGAGVTTITAKQVGNSEWNPAPDVTAILTVSVGTGIDELKTPLPVRTAGDKLIVTTDAGSRIDIYTVVGSRLQSAMSSGGETVFYGLPKGQVLIVRTGNAAAKVILR